MKLEEFVKALRDLADYYESNPDTPLPAYPVLNIFASRDADKAKQQFRQFGSFTKSFEGDWFIGKKQFGPIRVELNARRENVCLKVVVGTRKIPQHVIPAQPETVVPAHVEEITEWQCEPVLAEKVSA